MGGWAFVAVVFVGYALAARRLDRLSITAPIVLVVGRGRARRRLPRRAAGQHQQRVDPPGHRADPGADPLRRRVHRAAPGGSGRRAPPAPPARHRAPADDGARGPSRHTSCFPSISWWEAALIAAILAPTDAALGMAVVTNPAVPARIRRALNIEGGLNDGIVTPFVSVFLILVVVRCCVAALGGYHAAGELARGAGIGIAVGYVGGRSLRVARAAGWTTPVSDQLVVLGLAFVSYGDRRDVLRKRLRLGLRRRLGLRSGHSWPAARSHRVHRHGRAVLVVRRVDHLRGSVRRASAEGRDTPSGGHLRGCSASPSSGCCRSHWRWSAAGCVPMTVVLHRVVRAARPGVGGLHADRGRRAGRGCSRARAGRDRHVDDPALRFRPRYSLGPTRRGLRAAPGRPRLPDTPELARMDQPRVRTRSLFERSSIQRPRALRRPDR